MKIEVFACLVSLLLNNLVEYFAIRLVIFFVKPKEMVWIIFFVNLEFARAGIKFVDQVSTNQWFISFAQNEQICWLKIFAEQVAKNR